MEVKRRWYIEGNGFISWENMSMDVKKNHVGWFNMNNEQKRLKKCIEFNLTKKKTCKSSLWNEKNLTSQPLGRQCLGGPEKGPRHFADIWHQIPTVGPFFMPQNSSTSGNLWVTTWGHNYPEAIKKENMVFWGWTNGWNFSWDCNGLQSSRNHPLHAIHPRYGLGNCNISPSFERNQLRCTWCSI